MIRFTSALAIASLASAIGIYSATNALGAAKTDPNAHMPTANQDTVRSCSATFRERFEAARVAIDREAAAGDLSLAGGADRSLREIYRRTAICEGDDVRIGDHALRSKAAGESIPADLQLLGAGYELIGDDYRPIDSSRTSRTGEASPLANWCTAYSAVPVYDSGTVFGGGVMECNWGTSIRMRSCVGKWFVGGSQGNYNCYPSSTTWTTIGGPIVPLHPYVHTSKPSGCTSTTRYRSAFWAQRVSSGSWGPTPGGPHYTASPAWKYLC